jgi:opacity protein-like surface antigen
VDGAELPAEAEAGADDAGADDAGADEAGGAELDDVEAGAEAVAVGVAVAVAVGVAVVGVGVGVGVEVLDLVGVGVGVGVTTAGRTDEGVYAGAVDDGTLCEADGEVDALLGALDEGAGAEDVTAAGWSLS